MIDKIEGGGHSIEPEGAGRVNYPGDTRKKVERSGKSSLPRKVEDEYDKEDKGGTPQYPTYDNKGRLIERKIEPDQPTNTESEDEEENTSR